MPYSSPSPTANAITIVSTTSAIHSIGGMLMGMRNAAATNTTWASANRVIFVPFRFQTPVEVVRLLVGNGTTPAGNVDIGIYDTAFNKIIGGGNVAQSGATTWQSWTVSTTLAPGLYWVALKAESASANLLCSVNATSYSLCGAVYATGAAGDLAASYTPAARTSALVPLVGLAIQQTTLP